MNQRQREILAQKHKRRMSLFERHYIKPIQKAVASQMESFLSDLREKGMDEARKNMGNTILNTQIAKPVQNLYVGIASYFADKTYSELTREEKKGFGVDIDWIQRILNYINTQLLSKVIIPITETTKDQIIKVLTEAQENGWGYDKIASEITDLPRWRARLIVRTESVQAMYWGQKLGKMETGFETYDIWISAHDPRTRHAHRLMDGKTIDEGEKFMVPRYKNMGGVSVQVGVDLMEGPGDPKASIENLANCRCTKVTRLKRKEGSLIRTR